MYAFMHMFTQNKKRRSHAHCIYARSEITNASFYQIYAIYANLCCRSQKHRPVIVNDITKCVSNFLDGGKSLKEVNHTLIALIPKVDNLTMTSQFRAISTASVQKHF